MWRTSWTIVEVGGSGDAGVTISWVPRTLRRWRRRLRNSPGVLDAWPDRALVERLRAVRSLRGDRVADAFAFAEDPQDAVADGAAGVVDIERNDLADAVAGVSRVGELIESRPIVSWVNLVEANYRVQRDHGRHAADDTLGALRQAWRPTSRVPRE